jgi:hypothetical protein
MALPADPIGLGLALPDEIQIIQMLPVHIRLRAPVLLICMFAPDRAVGRTALLIIDMISCWDFPDAEKLRPAAVDIAPRIAALAARCRVSHVR